MRDLSRILPPSRHGAFSVLLLLASALCCAGASSARADNHRRRIYFLESLTPAQAATIQTVDGFKRRMAELTSEKFDIFIDYLELGRLAGQAHIDNEVRYLKEKYREAPPDLLIPLGRAAVPFLVEYRDAIAPQIPIVMADVPAKAVPEGKTLNNAVWVATEYSFAKTLALAERLQPNAHNLAIVGGASDYDRSWLDDAKRDLRSDLGRFKTRYIVGLPYDETLRQVSQLPADTIVLMSFVFVDGAGISRPPPDFAAAVAEASAAPTYAPISTFFSRGIVGGYMDSFEAHGVAAAELGAAILSGTPVTALKRVTEPSHRYEIDARQLKRWHLSAAALPTGAVLSFRTPTIWEQHHTLLIAAALIFAVQTGLLIVLLVQRHGKKLAETEAAEQRQEVTHLMRVSVLGELSGAIAHEINQPLTAILSNAQAALQLLAQKSPDLAEVRGAIDDIVHEDQRAGEVIGRLRSLLKKGERRFEPVDVNELIRSTLALLHSELIGRRFEVETDLPDRVPEIFGDPVQLQQVLLNLLMNAMDAMASTPVPKRQILISTRNTASGEIEILVRDHGHGISAEDHARLFKPFYTSKASGLGLGLTICSTIAQVHGGKLTLANHEAGGAVAAFSLPNHQLAPAK